MLDLKRWFNRKHYLRLWNVGPPGLVFSVFAVHGLHRLAPARELKTFSIGEQWLGAPRALIALDAVGLLCWGLFSLPPKNRGRKLSKKGIYAFIRHPIYTVIIYHMPILCSLVWGSFLLLFFLPLHHIIWVKIVQKEEEYLIGIFGQEYLDYMDEVPRFIPWF